MSEINPYEAPQADSRLPQTEARPPQSARRPPALWSSKPPAFGLAVMVQAICLTAAFVSLIFSQTSSRRDTPNDIRAIAAIMLAFAGLMGVGILIAAKRYNLQGWAVFETLLLTFIVFLFAVS